MLLIHVFDKDYRLIVTFDNVERSKSFLVSESSVAARSAWVSPCLANDPLGTIPMWKPYDFVDNFPHS